MPRVVGLGINGTMPERAGADIDQDWVDLAEVCGGDPRRATVWRPCSSRNWWFC
ncbi:hypothetical protein [Methylogaea oryzae]|uniref:hypothetical protein n=1 Tax=Methylogaea oryzae TaxID=1295382 RepID=UPI001C3F1DC3|nr:hypothetical protein [Methylogaea oryzae]